MNPRILILTFKVTNANKKHNRKSLPSPSLQRKHPHVLDKTIELHQCPIAPCEAFLQTPVTISPLVFQKLAVIICSQLRRPFLSFFFFSSLGRIIFVFRASLSEFRLLGFQIGLDRIEPSRFSHPLLIIIIFFSSHLGFQPFLAKPACLATSEIFEFDVVLVLHLLEKFGLGVLSVWLISVLAFVNDDYFLSSGWFV